MIELFSGLGVSRKADWSDRVGELDLMLIIKFTRFKKSMQPRRKLVCKSINKFEINKKR